MPENENERQKRTPPLGGGPLGHGDPEDKRLRKTEKEILIPKLMREEAKKKCSDTFGVFTECAKNSGLLFPFKCRAENDANNKCMESWFKNPEFVKEMTELYLERRSHYRKTGEPVLKYERVKKPE